MHLDGTAALVTGAASGLGQATCEALAKQGVSVFGLDLHSAVSAATPAAGVRLLAADVTSEEDVGEAFGEVRDQERPLRLVVNCAGIAPSQRLISKRGPHDLELFERTIRINLIGTFNVMRLGAVAMQESDPDAAGHRGVIVNTASVAAFEGQVGQIAYSASKAGVAGMTVTAARDLADVGIRVMTIAPGLVDTPMVAGFPPDVQTALAGSVTFPRRLARPAEFADLVVAIAQHDYLNGETIRMDGALRMTAR